MRPACCASAGVDAVQPHREAMTSGSRAAPGSSLHAQPDLPQHSGGRARERQDRRPHRQQHVLRATGDNVRLEGGSSNVEVRSNILWAETGYDLYVANDSQTGFFSDYNDLYATGSGRIAYWTRDFTDVLDWQADVARFDLHSIGATVVNPSGRSRASSTGARDDYRVFPIVAGLRFSSPTIDAGDPLTDQGLPASFQNLLANPGFETGLERLDRERGRHDERERSGTVRGRRVLLRPWQQQGFRRADDRSRGRGLHARPSSTPKTSSPSSAAASARSQRRRSTRGRSSSRFSTAAARRWARLPRSPSTRPTAGNWSAIAATCPRGTRSITFRFESDRQSGATNDAYLDGAFLYVVPDTVAPDQGAYGNTPAEAATSPRGHLALVSPDLYTDWQRDQLPGDPLDVLRQRRRVGGAHRSLPGWSRRSRAAPEHHAGHARRRRVRVDAGGERHRLRHPRPAHPGFARGQSLGHRPFDRTLLGAGGRQHVLGGRPQQRRRRVHARRRRIEPQHGQARDVAEAGPGQCPAHLRADERRRDEYRHRRVPAHLHGSALPVAPAPPSGRIAVSCCAGRPMPARWRS